MASDWPLRGSSTPARRPSASSIAATSTPASRRATSTCRLRAPRHTWATTPPRVTGGRPASQTLALDQRSHVAVTTLDRDERTRVQNQHQAAPRPCDTTVRLRARRAESRWSSSVISPCSAYERRCHSPTDAPGRPETGQRIPSSPGSSTGASTPAASASTGSD
jgi:hypothetical protein